MNLLYTAGNERLCGNDACRDYKSARTKLSRYNDEDYCGSCQRNPEVDTSKAPPRRHGTGEFNLINLRGVARRRGMTYVQISIECGNLGEEISVNTLSCWARGLRPAPRDDAITLMGVLDCTLKELTGD